MINIDGEINRYIRIRQININEIKGIDILDIIMKKYNFPKKSDIKEFISQSMKIYPKCKKIFLAYENDIIRTAKIKEVLNKYSHNPIICSNPLIVDINKYKNKKEISNNYFMEKGRYRVVNILKNVIVLEREKNVDEGIRINLEENISEYFKKGDILELMITRKLFVIYWDVVKVYKCIPKSMVNML